MSSGANATLRSFSDDRSFPSLCVCVCVCVCVRERERERERERVCDGVAALPIEQEFEIFINSPFAKHHRFT